jgi:phosphoserine phosphatase RsbU/P
MSDPNPDPSHTTTSPPDLGGPARILVVDDEPGIQRSAQRILERQYAVTLAGSGGEALEILSRQPHDLALVDVRMPGMTGFELLKSIKARHPDTEVIIMTGSVTNPDEKLVESLRERAFYFLHKPFEKTVLETLVQRCLERQRLERQHRAHTRALEADLERARAFQRMLLPSWFPLFHGLRGDVWYEPTARLGGDFYDFFTRGKSTFGVVLADVAGHGVMAALYTGMFKAELRVVQEEWFDPARLFRRLNERLVQVVRNQYITAILAILDLESHQLRYVNAGHPGFFTGDGRSWDSTGMPLGMLPGRDYETRTLPLEPGQRLFFYTDGLTEAVAEDGTTFGEERLRAAFLSTRGLGPDAGVAAIVGSVKAFAGARRLPDDATAILLECGPFPA